MSPPTVGIKVWGEFALFSRPELSVERMSYPCMTPSAARGVLDAILFKPQMAWHVRRIIVLRPRLPAGFPAGEADRSYRMIAVRRNEIQGTIAPRTVEGWMKQPASFEPYLVDSAGRDGAQGQNRTQRASRLLHHVAYLIEASPKLTDKANRPRDPVRGRRGPWPGHRGEVCGHVQPAGREGAVLPPPVPRDREFAAHFAPPDGGEEPLTGWSESLGFMLYDLKYAADGGRRPGFFEAKVANGVLHCDTEADGPNGEPPVTVFGWDDAGGEA